MSLTQVVEGGRSEFGSVLDYPVGPAFFHFIFYFIYLFVVLFFRDRVSLQL